MQKEKSEELYSYEEWTIENFSCWNREIHDGCISTLRTDIYTKFLISIYPKGENGQGEHILLRLNTNQLVAFSGELSYIGPDGSLLHKQPIDSVNEKTKQVTLKGPRFEEVVSAIKRVEDVHGDRLIVRYRIKRHADYKKFRKTTIEVFNAALRITPNILDELDSLGENISWLHYPHGEEIIGILVLHLSKGEIESTRLIFTLQPIKFESNVLVRTRLSVLSKDNAVMKTEDNEHLFRNDMKWTFAMSLTEEMRKKDSSFTLHFKIIPQKKMKQSASVLHYHKECVSLISTENLKQSAHKIRLPEKVSSLSLHNLSKELMCLQENQQFSDCQLKCGPVTLSAHKNILSARSPVFKTMLSCNMQEAASGCMDIEDLDPSTLVRFLTFLYTGVVEDELEVDSVLKLYYAADKYQVPTLKKECADILCCQVSLSNACSILSLADKHQDEQLLEVVHDFFLENFNEVLASKEWESFMNCEPLLAVKTVTQFNDEIYVRRR